MYKGSYHIAWANYYMHILEAYQVEFMKLVLFARLSCFLSIFVVELTNMHTYTKYCIHIYKCINTCVCI
jgi:hypothetical protein